MSHAGGRRNKLRGEIRMSIATRDQTVLQPVSASLESLSAGPGRRDLVCLRWAAGSEYVRILRPARSQSCCAFWACFELRLTIASRGELTRTVFFSPTLRILIFTPSQTLWTFGQGLRFDSLPSVSLPWNRLVESSEPPGSGQAQVMEQDFSGFVGLCNAP